MLLAPDIVEAILDGRQVPEMTLPVLMGAFPVEWAAQLPSPTCPVRGATDQVAHRGSVGSSSQ